MDADDLVVLTRAALLLMLKLSLAPVALATLAGVLVSLVQAATQIQDQTLPFFVKFCVVVGVLMVMGPWLARQLDLYTVMVFELLPMV